MNVRDINITSLPQVISSKQPTLKRKSHMHAYSSVFIPSQWDCHSWQWAVSRVAPVMVAWRILDPYWVTPWKLLMWLPWVMYIFSHTKGWGGSLVADLMSASPNGPCPYLGEPSVTGMHLVLASLNPESWIQNPKHIHICPDQWDWQHSYHQNIVSLLQIPVSICHRIALYCTHQQALTSVSLDVSGINHCCQVNLPTLVAQVSIQPHFSAVASAGHTISLLSPPSWNWKPLFRMPPSLITHTISSKKMDIHWDHSFFLFSHHLLLLVPQQLLEYQHSFMGNVGSTLIRLLSCGTITCTPTQILSARAPIILCTAYPLMHT